MAKSLPISVEVKISEGLRTNYFPVDPDALRYTKVFGGRQIEFSHPLDILVYSKRGNHRGVAMKL